MEINNYKLPLLVYDSECSLCQRFKDSLARLPGMKNIDAVSLHDSKLYEIYPFLDPDECGDQLHFLDRDGKVYRGQEAISALIEEVPGSKSFSWLLQKGMGKKAVNLFYKMADTKRKSLLNRCHTCK